MSDDRREPIEDSVRNLLAHIGEDPDREGLQKTPDRVARSYEFLTHGYRKSLEEVLGDAVFHETCDEMVVVKDVEVYSLCEHHLLPFIGRAHVAYIPDGRIIGLSKIPRIVELYARRLQVQERLTTQVATALQEALRPLGVGVVVEAQHLCMMMRGVEKQNSRAVTSCMLGAFQRSDKTRAEFLRLLRSPSAYL
jgi:GTP cyclohydrolase I